MNVSTKRFKELKSLSKDELASKIRDTEAALFDNKMKRVTGQLADSSAVWKLRKDLARMKMLVSQATEKTAGGK